MSAIDGQRITRVSATFPYYGQWRVDAVLEGGALPSGLVTVDLAGLIAVGTVDPEQSGFDAPDLPHVVVIGGIGWSAEVTAAAARSLTFHADSGVRLRSVLAALARAAGETIAQPTDRAIGSHWGAVSSAPGERVRYRDELTEMVRAGDVAGWYVDTLGTTRFVARATPEVTARATLLRANASVGFRVFGVDEPAYFMPGAIVEGVGVGRSVVLESPGSLTVECWS